MLTRTEYGVMGIKGLLCEAVEYKLESIMVYNVAAPSHYCPLNTEKPTSQPVASAPKTNKLIMFEVHCLRYNTSDLD